MKQANIVVQGKPVNASIIAAYAKRVGSIDEVLSVWANAGALQLAQHGNINWLNKLFDMQPLRLKSGDLSAIGKSVLQYLSAHYPALKWDKDNQKLARSKINKDSIQCSHFVDLTITDPAKVPAEQGIIEQRGKFWRPHGDFSLTLTEFKNLDRSTESDEQTEPSMTAKAFAKQADKALDMLGKGRFIGAVDELQSVADKLKALYLQIETDLAKARAAELPIDQAKAAELLKSGQQGKSARAGGKVEPAQVAA